MKNVLTKGWITNIPSKADTATAIDTYSAFQNTFTIIASSLAGFIWYQFGAAFTFGLTAFVSMGTTVYIYLLPYNEKAK